MGVLGQTLGSSAGHMLGTYIGKKIGDDYKGSAASIGSAVGGFAGNLLPFKYGGKVPGKKGQPKIILAHSGEFILPVNVKPTKEQKSKIEKQKKIKREKLPDYFV
jgi:hypothetical protein